MRSVHSRGGGGLDNPVPERGDGVCDGGRKSRGGDRERGDSGEGGDAEKSAGNGHDICTRASAGGRGRARREERCGFDRLIHGARSCDARGLAALNFFLSFL